MTREEKQAPEKTRDTSRHVKPRVENPATVLYFGAGFGLTTRSLTENTGLFAEPLGERSKETPIFTNSFFIGIRTRLHQQLYIDFGLSSAKYGEAYKYTQADSSFSYTTTYKNLALPVRLQYITPGKFKFIAGVGIQPQMFLKYKQEQEWTDTKGVDDSESISSRKGYTTFTISALANVGFEWQFGSNASLLFLPQAAWQLNSTLPKQAPYVHKGMIYQVQIGLVFGI